MDGNVYLIVVLVNDAYHLLIRVASGHANQAAKLADTEVYMHDEVARFHLLQLFHRQRQLAGACAFAFEIVFVETVEYLVIGEKADAKVVIHISCMQSKVACRLHF